MSARTKTLDYATLEARVREAEAEAAEGVNIDTEQLTTIFDSIDARQIESNLPNFSFESGGRNLDPARDLEPDTDGNYSLVLVGSATTEATGIEVGDRLTFAISGNEEDAITFRVVGITGQGAGALDAGTEDLYAPTQAFGERAADENFIVADIDEARISDVRRELSQVSGTFMLETRLINDLFNRVIDQFTSFPILVAVLAVATGGIVIANSVVLSTLERRREIGIMKAVGVQRERVLAMLLLENGLMGLIGGLIGVGLSFVSLVVLLVQIFGGELGNIIPWQTALALMSLCILISLVAAVLTVWRASGEKPLTVLRYE
ncbi:MAG: FtsX-like permease family protein [Anaerolineae bacterium]|nr:FtsX-like permease family protein [Anaerolineae bacterium]